MIPKLSSSYQSTESFNKLSFFFLSLVNVLHTCMLPETSSTRQTIRCSRCTTLKDGAGGEDCSGFKERSASLSTESSNITVHVALPHFYSAGLGLHNCVHFHDKMFLPEAKYFE